MNSILSTYLKPAFQLLNFCLILVSFPRIINLFLSEVNIPFGLCLMILCHFFILFPLSYFDQQIGNQNYKKYIKYTILIYTSFLISTIIGLKSTNFFINIDRYSLFNISQITMIYLAVRFIITIYNYYLIYSK